MRSTYWGKDPGGFVELSARPDGALKAEEIFD